MNQKEFYKRVAALLDTDFLQSKSVAVIGLGSGGSRVAAELGRLGIQLLLIEKPGELLEEHNIVRHLLGYGSLGRPKLSEMAGYIRNLNPSVEVSSYAVDVVEETERLERVLERRRPDLIATCTDDEPSKHAINQVAVRLGIPQTGAAVYDAGIGGEVYRVAKGGACYGCIADQLQLRYRGPKPQAPADYNNFDADQAMATCALNLDIEQIALLQCRMALDLLLKERKREFLGAPPEANLCVFANRVVPGAFSRPLHCEFFIVPKRAGCLDCGAARDGEEALAERILSHLTAPSSSAGQAQ